MIFVLVILSSVGVYFLLSKVVNWLSGYMPEPDPQIDTIEIEEPPDKSRVDLILGFTSGVKRRVEFPSGSRFAIMRMFQIFVIETTGGVKVEKDDL